MVAILIILFYFGKIKQIDIGKKNSPMSKNISAAQQIIVSKCLILDAITEEKVPIFFSLKTELRAEPLDCREQQQKKLGQNWHVALWIFTAFLCNHMLIVTCSILNISFHSFIIHSTKNLSWKQQGHPSLFHPHQSASPPSMWAHIRVCRSASLTGLWSQPAVCVCQRADVTGGNEGWTLGLESQPSPSLQKGKFFLFLSSTDIA